MREREGRIEASGYVSGMTMYNECRIQVCYIH